MSISILSARPVASHPDFLGKNTPAMAEAMEQDNPHFQLCATLAGHEQDVRAVGALATGEVVTGSRDMSVRLWRYEPAEGFSCSSTLLGHTHFVGAVSAVGTGVASGSNDKHVIEWDMEHGTPTRILEGHTVCHAGLEPRTSRQGPRQVGLLLTCLRLALDRTWSPACARAAT